MRIRRLAFALAAGRAAYGVLLLAAPKSAASPWIQEAASDERAQILARGLGARDFALAVGGLSALANRDTNAIRWWFAAQGFSDAADGVATALARRSLGPRRGLAVGAAALGSAAVGWSAALSPRS